MKADLVVPMVMQFGRGGLGWSGSPDAPDPRPYQDRTGWLGLIDTPRWESVDGSWQQHPIERRILFGRCDQFGYLTQQCYDLDHITEMERHRWGPDTDPWVGMLATTVLNRWWYFDAGGNGCPIRITHQELERGLRELGLIKEAS